MRPHLTANSHASRTANPVALTIFGETVEPDAITQALGLQPSHTLRKGQLHRVTPSGRIVPRSNPAPHGLWKHWPGDEWRTLSLDEQLALWAVMLKEHSATLRDYRQQGWTVELNCCIVAHTANVNIPTGLQASFAELGIDIDITFYQSHWPRYKTRHPVCK